jgi:hypothetical protein
MKTFIILALMAIGMVASAQHFDVPDSVKRKSNFEAFSNTTGTVFKREFVPLGKIKYVKFSLLKVTDMLSGKRMYCIHMNYVDNGIIHSYNVDRANTMDMDEVDALLNSFVIINDSIYKTKPVNYTEARFKSRGGCEAGCYWDDNKWSFYFNFDAFYNDCQQSMTLDQMNDLFDIFKKAKSLIS